MRLGYNNVRRLPHGYFGWRDENSPGATETKTVRQLGPDDFFPSCRLVVLSSERDRNYLHIQHNERTISLEDIQSEYIFIELYNEFCHQCLQEVKNYKALYSMLSESNSLKDSVKMMGIGVGSKKRQVAKFRKGHGIAFPLFADEQAEIFTCLGKPDLPTSYLVERHPNGGRKIIFVQSGHIKSTEKLMEKVRSIVTSKRLAVSHQPSAHE
ncbi:MAG: redoxin domain-containing protein [Deltaproteobacteria bacterium]|nr:MAG: redoxin domain-containing protein [Deltaproteobacteria bacterium]